MKGQSLISEDTVKAVGIIAKLFTADQLRVLEMRLGDQVITFVEQMLGRWWYHVPVSDSALVIKTSAARIIEVNKGFVDFIAEINKGDIFKRLLDPNTYKEISTKTTKFKGLEKRDIDAAAEVSSISKGFNKALVGHGGLNRSYEYSSKWDQSDRNRLDSLQMKRTEIPRVKTETGQEDDTRGSEREESEKTWLEKLERLDGVSSREVGVKKPSEAPVKFSDMAKDKEESIKSVELYDVNLQQGINAGSNETSTNSNSFVESLRRQWFSTDKEKYVLADAINNIKNVEFFDVREKILQKLDVLFVFKPQTCQY